MSDDKELYGLSDNEILARLKWDELIPDGRTIQQERLASVGSPYFSYNDSCESIMHRIEEASDGKDTRFSSSRRLVQLPDEKLREVYSLTIPLAIPGLDFSVRTGRHCSEWQSASFSRGAMHLTTQQNLDRLLSIFEEAQVPVTEGAAYGSVCDLHNQSSGKAVPHSWYVDTYDPHEELFTHQFVTSETRTFLVPYSTVSKRKEESERRGGIPHYITITNETRAYKAFAARTAVFCEEHLSEANDWIAKIYSKTKNGEGTEVAEIREPVLIYDPTWLSN